MYKNKTVAVIGAAPHLDSYQQSEKIQGFDIVVRFNYFYPIPDKIVECTTDRCDVLYVYDGVKYHPMWDMCKVYVRNNKGKYDKDYENLNDLYEQMKGVLDCAPNTGILALYHILSQKPKHVYVTGFTFFKTGGHYKGHADISGSKIGKLLKGNDGKHKQANQFAWFMDNVYPNVEVDPQLKKICSLH
jgi:hypothetical protein